MALLFQLKKMVIFSFVGTRTKAGGGIGEDQMNKTVETVTFKAIKSGKDKGKYIRTTYSIKIENGKITSVKWVLME